MLSPSSRPSPSPLFQGATKTNRYSSAKEVELCHYQGKVRGAPESWVAVSTCEDGHLRGVIFDGAEIHHVEPGYVYRHSDHFDEILRRAKRSVSNEKQHYKSKNGASPDNRNGTKRAAGIKGPWNANKRSRYVELLLVVDNKEFREHDGDLEKVQRICKDVANVMNSLYSPLNIYIALVGVVVWTEYDEITLSTKGDDTLTNFLHYRRERLVKDHPNDNAQLLTGIRFEGGVVGKALKGPMCTYEFSGGVNMWHSDVVGLVATTVAHEMGHNFGMEHDTEDCECPDDRCIMAPASSTLKPTFWSSCSLEYLALAFEHGMDYCLRNKPRALFDSPTCGNGFVEPGEECDCGLERHCDNPCCNTATCMLHANATCASGECCDFATCRPKSPGSVCRRSDHECDLPEYCTGQSEFCPADTHKVDGTACKVGQAFCFEGTCRTHSDQCKLLWGPSGKKSDNQCFEQNRKGTRHGNCGYNRLNGSYVKCNEENVRCGMLHCSHLNERLEFGMETVAILSHSFINHGGRIIPCRTALVDLGLNDVDPGLAPEGGRCGEGKMCVNRKCMPVAELRIGPHSCPSDCNGNGLCNSFGHCHCKVGYAPPDCLAAGSGGSVDSGPASDPEATSPATVFGIALLTVLPIVAVCAALFLYVQRTKRGKDDWRRFMEKAKGDGGAASPARKLEIGSPSEESKSNPPSPKVALLPRVDTTTTALGKDGEETLEGNSENEEEAAAEEQRELTVEYKQGRMAGGLFSGGFSRSRLKRKRSTSDIESGRPYGGSSSKLAFMQNLARSITFPGSKSREQAKYEIKVEHRSSPRPSTDSILSPVESPVSKDTGKTDDAAAANKPNSETDISMAESAAASPSSPSSTKQPTSTAESETSLSTTTKATGSPTKAKGKAPPPPRPPPRPSPAAIAAKKRPDPRTPPPPSYSSAIAAASASSPASAQSATASAPLPPSSSSPLGAMSSSASMPLQQQPAESIKSNPKLAFPHSSSFNSSGVLRSPFLAAVAAKNAQAGTPPLPTQTTFPTSSSASTLSSKTADIVGDGGESASTSKVKSSQSAGSLGAKLNNSSAVAPLSAPSLVKDGVDGSAADRPRITSRFVEPKQEEERLSAYERAKAAAIPPPVPAKKPASPIEDRRPTPTSPTKELGESRDTLTGSPVRLNTFNSFGKPAHGSMTKTSTLPTSLASAAGNMSRMSKSSTLPVDGGKRPEISRPILQTATPSASALIDRAPSTGISQTSILSTRPERPERRDKSSRGVVFSDQLTLPSPTNPYNPPIIHQPSSISSSNQSTPEADALAVSVTSASQVQQAMAAPPIQKATATVFTPTWSTEPKPLSSDAVLCHIDGAEGVGGGGGTGAPMAAAEVDASSEAKDKVGGLSKFKAKLGGGPSVKRSASAVTESSRENTPERRQSASPTPSNNSQSSFQGPGGKPSLRNLEISGPILQYSSLAGSSPMPPPPTGSTTSPVPTRAAPPPPVTPRGHKQETSPLKTGAVPKTKEKPSALKHSKSLGSSSKRPASIATTRPVRPTAPPPPRPPAEKPPKPPASATPTTATVAKTTSKTERPSSIDISSPTATDDGEFVTPTTSPLFERRSGRKSPDAVSTASSEGDLLKEILKEMDGGPKKGKGKAGEGEEEGVYSTLMRKKKRQQQGEKQPALSPK